MACNKCIHHPECWLVCRSIHEGEYLFTNAAACLPACLPAWLVCIDTSICSRGHVWLVVHHANLLLMHAKQCLSINTGPFLKPRVSKSTRIHWRTRKCGQISGHMDRIDHNNQSKIQGDLQMLPPAAFAWLQYFLEFSWPATSASIIQSAGWCADQSMKVSIYLQMLLPACLPACLPGWFV